MKKFDKILERTNREVFNPVGLNFLPPRKNAFLFVCRLFFLFCFFPPYICY